jgi:hypothetical protein
MILPISAGAALLVAHGAKGIFFSIGLATGAGSQKIIAHQ